MSNNPERGMMGDYISRRLAGLCESMESSAALLARRAETLGKEYGRLRGGGCPDAEARSIDCNRLDGETSDLADDAQTLHYRSRLLAESAWHYGTDGFKDANRDIDGRCRMLTPDGSLCLRPTVEGTRWCEAHIDMWCGMCGGGRSVYSCPTVVAHSCTTRLFLDPSPVPALRPVFVCCRCARLWDADWKHRAGQRGVSPYRWERVF